MRDRGVTPPAPAAGGGTLTGYRRSARDPQWLAKVILGFSVLVAAALFLLLVVVLVPLWWDQRLATLTADRIWVGVPAGLGSGALFTLAPLFALPGALRRGRSLRSRGLRVGLVVVLAAPNVLVFLDPGMGSRAPGFRAATGFGIAIGLCLALVLAVAVSSARGRRAETQRLYAVHRANQA